MDGVDEVLIGQPVLFRSKRAIAHFLPFLYMVYENLQGGWVYEEV